MKKKFIKALSMALVFAVMLSVGMPVLAADGNTFNAGLIIDDSEPDQIIVTVNDDSSAVLEEQKPALTVKCPFGEAYVVHNDEVILSALDAENGTITFTVATSGDYAILLGQPPLPDDVEDVDEEELIDAVNDAYESGSTTVKIPVDKGINGVQLSADIVADVVDLGMGFEFVIALDDVTISISAEALEAISEQATGDTILISVESVEKNVLNEKQSSALAEIKDKSVAQVLQASVISNGKTISDFKGGKVGVELPYKLGSGWDKDDFAMLYVSDDGKTEDIPLDHKNDAFHMTLTHFSEYVLMKSNSGHGGGEIAQPTPTPNPGATGGDVDTGDDFSILLWAAVLVVAVVGVVLTVVLLRRKRDQ